LNKRYRRFRIYNNLTIPYLLAIIAVGYGVSPLLSSHLGSLNAVLLFAAFFGGLVFIGRKTARSRMWTEELVVLRLGESIISLENYLETFDPVEKASGINGLKRASSFASLWQFGNCAAAMRSATPIVAFREKFATKLVPSVESGSAEALQRIVNLLKSMESRLVSASLSDYESWNVELDLLPSTSVPKKRRGLDPLLATPIRRTIIFGVADFLSASIVFFLALNVGATATEALGYAVVLFSGVLAGLAGFVRSK
jgi:hypothetical protein